MNTLTKPVSVVLVTTSYLCAVVSRNSQFGQDLNWWDIVPVRTQGYGVLKPVRAHGLSVIIHTFILVKRIPIGDIASILE